MAQNEKVSYMLANCHTICFTSYLTKNPLSIGLVFLVEICCVEFYQLLEVFQITDLFFFYFLFFFFFLFIDCVFGNFAHASNCCPEQVATIEQHFYCTISYQLIFSYQVSMLGSFSLLHPWKYGKTSLWNVGLKFSSSTGSGDFFHVFLSLCECIKII